MVEVAVSLPFLCVSRHGRTWELQQLAKQSEMLMEPQPAKWEEFDRKGPKDREAVKDQRVQCVIRYPGASTGP